MKTVEGSSSKKSDPNEESSLEDELSEVVPSLDESVEGSGAIGLLGGKLPGCSPCLVVVELDELRSFLGSHRIARSTVLSRGNTDKARAIGVTSLHGIFLCLWVSLLFCDLADVLSRTLIAFPNGSVHLSEVPGS